MGTHRPSAISRAGHAIRKAGLPWVLPRIVELQPEEWDRFLERARAVKFDLIERIGVIAGVAFVAYLLRFDSQQTDHIPLPLYYAIQFLAAVPLLVLFAGPFYLRCLRRALDREIERRHLVGHLDL